MYNAELLPNLKELNTFFLEYSVFWNQILVFTQESNYKRKDMKLTNLLSLVVPISVAMCIDLNNKEELHGYVQGYINELVEKHQGAVLASIQAATDPENEQTIEFHNLQQGIDLDKNREWTIGESQLKQVDDNILGVMIQKLYSMAKTNLWKRFNLKETGLYYYSFTSTNIFEDL